MSHDKGKTRLVKRFFDKARSEDRIAHEQSIFMLTFLVRVKFNEEIP